MLELLSKSDPIAIASLIVALVGFVVSIWLAFRYSWQDHATFLEIDPDERTLRIAELRGGSFGKLYPALLKRGLTLLDRRFGAPFSPKALNVCTLLALGYAYLFSFVAYVMGAPGGLGEGMAWLPPTNETPVGTRLAIAAVSIFLPPLAFLLTRWLGRFALRWERRFKLCTRRRLGLKAFRFDVVHRLLLAGIIGGGTFLIGSTSATLEGVLFFAMLGGLAAAASLVGYHVARRFPWSWLRGALGALAGVAVGAGALAGVVTVAVVGTGALALTIAVALATAVAGVGAVVGALVGAVVGAAVGTLAGPGALAVAFAAAVGVAENLAVAEALAIAGALSIALAGAVSTVGPSKHWNGQRGLYSGSLGVFIGFALILTQFGGNQFGNELAVAWITLFFALPVVNGIWDFGSWWISRSLGRHLMAKIDGKAGAGGQGWTIFWHIALDLALAVSFLLSLAWFFGFAFESYHNIGIRWTGIEEGALPALAKDIAIAAAEPFGKGLWLTAMLLSTLLPTLLHGVMAIAGAVTLFRPVTAARRSLAEDLEALDHLDKAKQTLVLQRAGRYVANGRPVVWLFATLLLLALLFLLSNVVMLIHEDGFSTYARDAALSGLAASDWLFRMN